MLVSCQAPMHEPHFVCRVVVSFGPGQSVWIRGCSTRVCGQVRLEWIAETLGGETTSECGAEAWVVLRRGVCGVRRREEGVFQLFRGRDRRLDR
jgi:hypothetical protein